MYKSIIFVDFENVQYINTSQIDTKTKIIVMVGLDQNKKAFEFTKDLFNKVSSIELIKVNGRGNNALDFFIAFYLGKYFDTIKEAEIIIISKDTGYDQLINHLNGDGISIKREGLAKNVNKQGKEKNEPKQKLEKPKNETETNYVQTVLNYLKNQTESQKNKRPKKKTTLINDLTTHFPNIQKNNIEEAIDIIIKKKIITITDNKIDYKEI